MQVIHDEKVEIRLACLHNLPAHHRRSDMDKLKQIEAFIAVVEHGSMAAAALTPPPGRTAPPSAAPNSANRRPPVGLPRCRVVSTGAVTPRLSPGAPGASGGAPGRRDEWSHNPYPDEKPRG